MDSSHPCRPAAGCLSSCSRRDVGSGKGSLLQEEKEALVGELCRHVEARPGQRRPGGGCSRQDQSLAHVHAFSDARPSVATGSVCAQGLAPSPPLRPRKACRRETDVLHVEAGELVSASLGRRQAESSLNLLLSCLEMRSSVMGVEALSSDATAPAAGQDPLEILWFSCAQRARTRWDKSVMLASTRAR